MTSTRFAPSLLLLLVALKSSAAEPARLPDSTAADRGAVALTVYNVNLALVRETRALSIPRTGVATLRFMERSRVFHYAAPWYRADWTCWVWRKKEVQEVKGKKQLA